MLYACTIFQSMYDYYMLYCISNPVLCTLDLLRSGRQWLHLLRDQVRPAVRHGAQGHQHLRHPGARPVPLGGANRRLHDATECTRRLFHEHLHETALPTTAPHRRHTRTCHLDRAGLLHLHYISQQDWVVPAEGHPAALAVVLDVRLGQEVLHPAQTTMAAVRDLALRSQGPVWVL